MAIGPFRPELLRAPLQPAKPHRVERLAFVNAPPRAVWASLHDPEHTRTLFPELRLGPPEPTWPAAAAIRVGQARIGLLHDDALVESLEARPLTSFRLRVTGRAFDSEWRWRLEPRAGGTRVVHDAMLQPGDRIADWLIRLGRDSLSERVEAHLRALKEVAESDWRSQADPRSESRLA
jgi:carbon monoxide dehydrogenase subunit G